MFRLSTLLRHRYLSSVMLSMLFSQCGTWIRNYVALLAVMERSGGDVFSIALISVAEYAPLFAFSIIGGALADRWRPKRTIVSADLLAALSLAAICGLLAAGLWEALWAAVLVSSILSQVASPAGMKLFQRHVSASEAPAAMSLLQTVMSAFMIAGPALGVLVYRTAGASFGLLLAGVAFLCSALSLLAIPADTKHDARTETQSRSLASDIADGLRYVRGRTILLRLSLSFGAVGAGVGLITPLGVFVVTERLDLPATAMPWLSIPYGAGELIGGVAAFAIAAKLGPGRMLLAGLLLDGIGVLLMGQARDIAFAAVIQFAIAFGQPFIFAGNQSLSMMHTDPAYLGRVSGIRTPIMTGAMLAAMSVAPLLAAWLSLSVIYAIAACTFAIGAVIAAPAVRSSTQPKQT